jgi:hypothetical protein
MTTTDPWQVIRARKSTKARLATKGIYGDTEDAIINRLIDYAEMKR